MSETKNIDVNEYVKMTVKKIKGRLFYHDERNGFCFSKRSMDIEYLFKDGEYIPINQILLETAHQTT
jgi:hypothetical protein